MGEKKESQEAIGVVSSGRSHCGVRRIKRLDVKQNKWSPKETMAGFTLHFAVHYRVSQNKPPSGTLQIL